MRIHTRLYVVTLLLAAGCARKNDNSGARGVTAPTPSSHTYFDISSGPHAVWCDTCHGSFATFTQFDCLSCHAHDATTTARLHGGTAGYSYDTRACLKCHGPGTPRMTFDHAGITSGCATCHDVGASFAALPAKDFVHEDT